MSKKDFLVIVLDFGVQKIGSCVGNSITGTSTQLKLLKNNKKFHEQLELLNDEFNPELFIIGLPKNPKNLFMKSLNKTLDFIVNTLEKRYELTDESFTSQAVEKEFLKNKDCRSAELIFEGWYNGR